MLKRLYQWLHRKFSLPDERGEYSAGRWQHGVRERVLAHCAGASGNVLDVGCGEGLLLGGLRQQGFGGRMTGVDIWNDILSRCRGRLGKDVSLVQASAVALPFATAVFDPVVCVNVFFNLPSWEQVTDSIRELARVCRTGGSVIIDIRNRANLFLAVKYATARFYDPTAHNLALRTYYLRDIEVVLASYGLRDVVCESVGWPHNRFAPIFVIKAVKR